MERFNKQLLNLLLIAVIVISGCVKKQLQSNVTLGPGDYDFSIEHDGLERTYEVHVPPMYDRKTPLPVVLVIHGGGGDAHGARLLTEFDSTADKEGFIAVYPEGTGRTILGKTLGSWNGGRCCPPASKNNVDDVGFISTLIETLKGDFAIDEQRIFATGHSNGAIMAYKLACDLSDKIAAIAPLGGQGVFEQCSPQRNVPIFHIHGTEDNCAKFEGGTCGGCSERYLREAYKIQMKEAYLWSCESVPDHIQGWAQRYGLGNTTKVTYQKGNATCITYGPGENNEEVTLCTVEGMGHTWPNGDYGTPCARGENTRNCRLFKEIVGKKTGDINANEAVLEFFKKHPMR